MPDRAIIPLLPAVALGFIAGVIGSTLQFTAGTALAVFLAGAALVVIAGGTSVLGVRGETGERAIVGAIRAGLAVATFGFLYYGLLTMMRDAHFIVGLLLVAVAGVFGLLLTQPSVRDRGPAPAARRDPSAT